MLPAFLAFAIGAIVALLLTPVAGRLARKVGAIDVANSLRKVHRRPVPRLGGLAIVGGAFAATAAVTLGAPIAGDARLFGLAAGALLVAGLGLRDDVRGTGAATKIMVQACAAVVAWYAGFDLESFWSPFGALELGPLNLPLTVLWIVGVTNAVNLVDGMDGLAAGIASIAGAALSLMALWQGDLLVGVAAAATSGASLGFLKWNRHPASIFMGDSGSLFLGFLLAVLSLTKIGTHGTPLLPAVLVLGIPVGDTLLAIVRRTARGVPVHLGDRGHLHHRLLANGLSPLEAAFALHLAGLGCAIAGLALAASSGLVGVVFLALFVLAAVLGLRAIGMRPLFAFRTIVAERARNLALRRLVHRAGRDIAVAGDRQGVVSAVTSAALAMGAARAEVEPCGESSGAPAHGGGRELRSRHALATGRQPPLELVLEWDRLDGGLDRDREIAVEQLCANAARALGRMARRDAPQGTWALLRALRRSETRSLARVD